MIVIILGVIATSLLLAPMGCVLLWQRYNYFSDGLAHACLFSGIVSYFLNLPQLASMLVVSVIFASIIFILKGFSNKNTIINLVSSSMVATAIIFASKIPDSSIVETMLFGDIFSFTQENLYIVLFLDFLVLILLTKFLKPLMLVSVNADLARVQKISVNILEYASLLILALVVTVTIKNIGALLITALLVIPSATARIMSNTPTKMIIYSIIIALLAAIIGLYASFQFDLPLASSVAIISVVLYIIAACINFKRRGRVLS
jgi:zinc transport system permease protein